MKTSLTIGQYLAPSRKLFGVGPRFRRLTSQVQAGRERGQRQSTSSERCVHRTRFHEFWFLVVVIELRRDED